MTIEYKKWQDVVKKRKKEGAWKSLLPLSLLLPPGFLCSVNIFLRKLFASYYRKCYSNGWVSHPLLLGLVIFLGFKAPPTYHKFRAKVRTNRDFN